MGLLFGKRRAAQVDKPAKDPAGSARVVDVREYPQSGTFRGYKRYRLATYEEPGVSEGIEALRTGDPKHPFSLRGAAIRLVFKEVHGAYARSFTVMEVYVNQHKVGVLYDGNSQYNALLSEPFDKIHVRIEETAGRGQFFDGVEVYLFAHYPSGAPVNVDYTVE